LTTRAHHMRPAWWRDLAHGTPARPPGRAARLGAARAGPRPEPPAPAPFSWRRPPRRPSRRRLARPLQPQEQPLCHLRQRRHATARHVGLGGRTPFATTFAKHSLDRWRRYPGPATAVFPYG